MRSSTNIHFSTLCKSVCYSIDQLGERLPYLANLCWSTQRVSDSYHPSRNSLSTHKYSKNWWGYIMLLSNILWDKNHRVSLGYPARLGLQRFTYPSIRLWKFFFLSAVSNYLLCCYAILNRENRMLLQYHANVSWQSLSSLNTRLSRIEYCESSIEYCESSIVYCKSRIVYRESSIEHNELTHRTFMSRGTFLANPASSWFNRILGSMKVPRLQVYIRWCLLVLGRYSSRCSRSSVLTLVWMSNRQKQTLAT